MTIDKDDMKNLFDYIWLKAVLMEHGQKTDIRLSLALARR